MTVTLALAALAVASPAPPLKLPVVTPGCQGEACWTKGVWIVKAPLPLYAKPGAPKPVATLRKGLRITALDGIIRTTRIGTAVLVQDIDYVEPGGERVRLMKGASVRVLYDEGEGYFGGLAPDGRPIQLEYEQFRTLTEFRADDWVRVRLPSGRIGWIRHDYDRLDCSSYYDDYDRCRALGAGATW
jgi:hypothetical protein